MTGADIPPEGAEGERSTTVVLLFKDCGGREVGTDEEGGGFNGRSLKKSALERT